MSATPLDLLLFEWLWDLLLFEWLWDFFDIRKYKGENGCQVFLLLIRWKMKSSPLLEVICVLIFLIILVIQHLKIWDPVSILSQKEQVHQPLKLNVYSSPCNCDAWKKCGSNLIVITLNSLTFSVSWLLSHLHVLSNDFLIGCCWALLCFRLFYVCK